jgi:hypothetical protein
MEKETSYPGNKSLSVVVLPLIEGLNFLRSTNSVFHGQFFPASLDVLEIFCREEGEEVLEEHSWAEDR